MIARQLQRSRTTACNDNGFITFGRSAVGPIPTILRVAKEAGRPIVLSYVADSVLIISRA
jgi:hypothetical protein